MRWIFSNLPLLIFLFFAFSMVRAAMRAAKQAEQNKAGTNETEEQRRVREIQERIRRKIAERRGGVAPVTSEAEAAGEVNLPPVVRRMTVSPLDPFGGPSRRLVDEVRRRAVPAAPEPAPATDAAILERQHQLVEQMRQLEETRVTALRRAAVVAQDAATVVRNNAGAVRRAGWVDELRDPANLRRAIVMREVLGAPVALR